MASEFIKRQKNDFYRDISAFGSLYAYILLILIFLYLKNYIILKKLTVGLTLIYVITIAVRTCYFKDRPKKYPYSSFTERLDASSFPSLHSERIAFLSALFIMHFNNILISVFLIMLTIAVAYSRTYLKNHDLKDVSAGIIFGLIVYAVVEAIF